MPHKYLAFDIETAKVVPGSDFDWKRHRPLGITCIASQTSDCDEPRIWTTRDMNGNPAAQMAVADIAAFVEFVKGSVGNGLIPLTWNGLSFDFDVLAEESRLGSQCKLLAAEHVDMMFHIVCEKGFPVALKNAALGLGVAGKLSGVEGLDAPSLWANGEFEKVFTYVAQDVRTTLAVALESEKRKSFAWTTRKGTTSQMPLKNGWLSVNAAMKLPLPDTSWMPNPPSRRNFAAWLKDNH